MKRIIETKKELLSCQINIYGLRTLLDDYWINDPDFYNYKGDNICVNMMS